ncbi:tryptophan synthase subunit alpha [soil metagenome]
MSRIAELFSRKNKNVLNVYFTAGYPQLTDTAEILKSLQHSGADLIEIGIPYSDPIADGPVIQQSNTIALENGISIKKIFEQITAVKNDLKIPLILMGYLNPVMQYGIQKFCEDAAAAGIDGLILPDLPADNFDEYKHFFQSNDLDFIFLVTPRTSDERVLKLDKLSSGFLYAVSSSSTTGNNNSTMNEQQEYFKRLQSLKLKNPILAGFGIKDKNTFTNACEYTNGAIIGSAYIQVLCKGGNISENTNKFLTQIIN